MKYYIIDDEIGIVKTLQNIIECRLDGDVVGYQTNPEKAINEVAIYRPDVVLVDYLMAEMDGVSFVEKMNKICPEVDFVMISKVVDKAMVAQSYKAGVDFFITKPVNITEIESVLKKIEEHRKTNDIVDNIKDLFAAGELKKVTKNNCADMDKIKMLMSILGMNGEKGAGEIVLFCDYLLNKDMTYSSETLERFAESINQPRKNVEQRMRRTIKKGLHNAAYRGIEDFSDEVFKEYASYVFEFTSLVDEMNYLKSKSSVGGSVNLAKFIDGALAFAKNYYI